MLDGAAQQLAADQGQATPAAGEEEQEEVTVEHNGMVITHVPASEARKVRPPAGSGAVLLRAAAARRLPTTSAAVTDPFGTF